jgi:hypothetical protein
MFELVPGTNLNQLDIARRLLNRTLSRSCRGLHTIKAGKGSDHPLESRRVYLK